MTKYYAVRNGRIIEIAARSETMARSIAQAPVYTSPAKAREALAEHLIDRND